MELYVLAGVSLLGNALAVWGVVRHELARMREEIDRAHKRIDALPSVSKLAALMEAAP